MLAVAFPGCRKGIPTLDSLTKATPAKETKVLRDGQLVRADAGRGIVTAGALQPPPAEASAVTPVNGSGPRRICLLLVLPVPFIVWGPD